eukprot:scpid75981/ scgid20561/ 
MLGGGRLMLAIGLAARNPCPFAGVSSSISRLALCRCQQSRNITTSRHRHRNRATPSSITIRSACSCTKPPIFVPVSSSADDMAQRWYSEHTHCNAWGETPPLLTAANPPSYHRPPCGWVTSCLSAHSFQIRSVHDWPSGHRELQKLLATKRVFPILPSAMAPHRFTGAKTPDASPDENHTQFHKMVPTRSETHRHRQQASTLPTPCRKPRNNIRASATNTFVVAAKCLRTACEIHGSSQFGFEYLPVLVYRIIIL